MSFRGSCRWATSVRRRAIGAGAVVLLGALAVGPAPAGSVVPMTVETLADHAGQVVVGTVASVRSYWAAHPRRIETEVTFTAAEFWKGRLSESTSTATLLVPGGRVGDTQMRLCCAPEFATGDKWVLFVLPSYKTHPVAGLWQGAFRVVADEQGIERVYNEALHPVTGIDATGFVRVAGLRRRSGHRHHPVESSGVRVRPVAPPPKPAAALTLPDFAALLQPILTASRDHHLTEPAGRRAAVQLRAVPLRGADRPSAARPPVADVVRGGRVPVQLPVTPRPTRTPTDGERP